MHNTHVIDKGGQLPQHVQPCGDSKQRSQVESFVSCVESLMLLSWRQEPTHEDCQRKADDKANDKGLVWEMDLADIDAKHASRRRLPTLTRQTKLMASDHLSALWTCRLAKGQARF